ncbi:MAG: hypothetical protein Q9206_002142 [Seirophora lacunosa]
MPIPHNPRQPLLQTTEPPELPPPNIIEPESSEESFKPDLCDGSLSTAASWNVAENEDIRPRKAEEQRSRGGVCTSDRNELIERIKRGESPTWIPSQTLQEEYSKTHDDRHPPSPPKPAPYGSTPLQAAAEVRRSGNSEGGESLAEFSPPSEIKRPRSALHAGDFNRATPDVPAAFQQIPFTHQSASLSTQPIIGTSPPISWYSLDQPSQYGRTSLPTSAYPAPYETGPITPRSRAPSLNSYSSSFIPRAPTTPLVQQSNSTDIDVSPIDLSINPSPSNRRHTLPPRPLQSKELFPHDQVSPDASTAHRPPSLPADSTCPFQTHRPRRSLTTTYSLQASPTLQKPPFLRSRRQSLSTESPPLQNASMVGSYEESILRGWMSTAPSKPLDFTAQIGVLGRSNCKPQFPAHVTVPFPAVFYSWGGGGTGRRCTNVDNEPSPYVGHIDLQQLPTPAESKKTHRSRSKSPPHPGSFSTVGNMPPERNASQADQSNRRHEKRRRASSARSGLQGGYRIPREGQLQIIIKNPNKTAVKLFLVPYNLKDMEGGSKTFIRQRCYSADPVIDGMPSKGIEPEISLSENTAKNKPTLRYLIHVNICSPSNGRFYLYQHIRVVFANRVPDNKELLQTEIQVPQPRYSVYNPISSHSRSLSGSGAGLVRDKAYKRHNPGFGGGLEVLKDEHLQTRKHDASSPVQLESPPGRTPAVPRIPFHLTSTRAIEFKSEAQADSVSKLCGISALGTNNASEYSMRGGPAMSARSATPFHCPTARRQCPGASQHGNSGPVGFEPMDMDRLLSQAPLTDETNDAWSRSTGEEDGFYGKVSKSGARYAGQPSRPQPGEGLLARKLKGLGMQRGNGEEI